MDDTQLLRAADEAEASSRYALLEPAECRALAMELRRLRRIEARARDLDAAMTDGISGMVGLMDKRIWMEWDELAVALLVAPNAGLNRPGSRSEAEAGGSELKPLLGAED